MEVKRVLESFGDPDKFFDYSRDRVLVIILDESSREFSFRLRKKLMISSYPKGLAR